MVIKDIDTFAKEIAGRVKDLMQKDGMDIRQVDVVQRGLVTTVEPKLATCGCLSYECLDPYFHSFCKMLENELYKEEQLLIEMAEYIAQTLKSRYLRYKVVGLYKRLDENKEVILRNVFPYLLKQEGNEEYLKDKAWRPFLNMAVAYRIQLEVSDREVRVGKGDGNILVTSSFLKEMAITEEEMYAAAVENVESGFRISEMREIPDVIEDDDKQIVSPSAKCSDIVMYLMGTEAGEYGAGAVLAEEKISEFANEKGLKSFYLLPTSIHDFLVVTGDDVKKENLKSLLELIYELYVVEAEQLIDSVYLFDVKTGFRVV